MRNSPIEVKAGNTIRPYQARPGDISTDSIRPGDMGLTGFTIAAACFSSRIMFFVNVVDSIAHCRSRLIFPIFGRSVPYYPSSHIFTKSLFTFCNIFIPGGPNYGRQ